MTTVNTFPGILRWSRVNSCQTVSEEISFFKHSNRLPTAYSTEVGIAVSMGIRQQFSQ